MVSQVVSAVLVLRIGFHAGARGNRRATADGAEVQLSYCTTVTIRSMGMCW